MSKPPKKISLVRENGPQPVATVRNLPSVDTVELDIPSVEAEESQDLEAEPLLRLDTNELGVPPCPLTRRRLQQLFDNPGQISRFPRPYAPKYTDKLSDLLGYPRDQILAAGGAYRSLLLISRTYLSKSKTVVAVKPAWRRLQTILTGMGVTWVPVHYSDPFEADSRDVLEAIDEDTDMVVLSVPDRVTGAMLPPEDVDAICAKNRQAMVVVDTTFAPFASLATVPLLRDNPNLAIIGSLDNAYGLASLGAGYILASKSIIEDLSKLADPHCISLPAEEAACAALDDIPYYQKAYEEIRKAKLLLFRFLEERKLEVMDTPANFLLWEQPQAKEVVAKLKARSIWVKDLSDEEDLPDTLCASLGTTDQAKRVIRALQEIYADMKEEE